MRVLFRQDTFGSGEWGAGQELLCCGWYGWGLVYGESAGVEAYEWGGGGAGYGWEGGAEDDEGGEGAEWEGVFELSDEEEEGDLGKEIMCWQV